LPFRRSSRSLSLRLCWPANPGLAVSPSAEQAADAAKQAIQDQAASAGAKAAESVEKILGSYVGEFGDNKITLLITKAGDGVVSGRTIVGGNDRPFEGKLAVENGSYNIEAREPGDHKDDGTFKFSIADSDPKELKGTWKANDTKRPEKTYTLERKEFEYRKDVGNWPEASQRLLKTADVENLAAGELAFMRNEIFARTVTASAEKKCASIRERRLVHPEHRRHQGLSHRHREEEHRPDQAV
jgi:hypothetical protein